MLPRAVRLASALTRFPTSSVNQAKAARPGRPSRNCTISPRNACTCASVPVAPNCPHKRRSQRKDRVESRAKRVSGMRAGGGESTAAHLGDPHGLVVLGDDAGDVALVVGDVRRRVVDVDRDGINRAAGARGEERVEPRGAHRGPAVRDGGRHELGTARERLDVRLPRLRGRLRAQVGLRAEVGLVEPALRLLSGARGVAGGEGTTHPRMYCAPLARAALASLSHTEVCAASAPQSMGTYCTPCGRGPELDEYQL